MTKSWVLWLAMLPTASNETGSRFLPQNIVTAGSFPFALLPDTRQLGRCPDYMAYWRIMRAGILVMDVLP